MSSLPPRAFLFDLFRTLAAPMPAAALAAELSARGLNANTPGYRALLDGCAEGRLLAALGLDLESANRVLLTRPLADAAAIAAALPNPRGVALAPTLLAETAELFDVMTRGCRLLDGAAETLDALSASGVQLGLVSNASTLSSRVFDHLGLGRWFARPVWSWQVGHCKPSPAAFHTALMSAGVSAECAVMVGDTWPSDVVGALRVGLRAAWLDWGDDPIADAVYADRLAELGETGPDGAPRFTPFARATLARWLPVDVDDVERELGARAHAGAATPRPPAWLTRVTRIRRLADVLALCEVAPAAARAGAEMAPNRVGGAP